VQATQTAAVVGENGAGAGVHTTVLGVLLGATVAAIVDLHLAAIPAAVLVVQAMVLLGVLGGSKSELANSNLI